MKKYFLAFIFILMLMPFSFAWAPSTHQYICDESLMSPELTSSSIANLIKEHRQAFDAGFTETDITIIYYYTSGKKYEATHSWNFQRALMDTAMNDDMRAFAYGVAAHLIADCISHNNYIPMKIQTTYMPNYLIHPVSEAVIETHIIENYPQEYAKAARSLDYISGPNAVHPEYIDWVQRQITSSSGEIIDVRKDTLTLQNALGSKGGFFASAFKLPDIYQSIATGNLLAGIIILLVVIGGIIAYKEWRIGALLVGVSIALSMIILGAEGWGSVLVLSAIGLVLIGVTRLDMNARYIVTGLIAFIFGLISIVLLTGGISAWTSSADADQWVDISIDKTVYYFQPQNWEMRAECDPSGFEILNAVDASVFFIDILILAAIIGGAIAAIYLYRKE